MGLVSLVEVLNYRLDWEGEQESRHLLKLGMVIDYARITCIRVPKRWELAGDSDFCPPAQMLSELCGSLRHRHGCIGHDETLKCSDTVAYCQKELRARDVGEQFPGAKLC